MLQPRRPLTLLALVATLLGVGCLPTKDECVNQNPTRDGGTSVDAGSGEDGGVCVHKGTCTADSAPAPKAAGTILLGTQNYELGSGSAATLALRHKIDVDPQEGGCVTAADITLLFGDDDKDGHGCNLTLAFVTEDGVATLKRVSVVADSNCPGFPDDREGTYELAMPVATWFTGPRFVPDATKSETCVAGMKVTLPAGDLTLKRMDGETLTARFTNVSLDGEFVSLGSTSGQCPGVQSMPAGSAQSITTLAASPGTIVQGDSVTFTATVADPAGAGNIAGGELKNATGTATYGAFTKVRDFEYAITLTWEQLNATVPIDTALGGGTQTLMAVFHDAAGATASKLAPLHFRCGTDSTQAVCDGYCSDLTGDLGPCARCGNECSAYFRAQSVPSSVASGDDFYCALPANNPSGPVTARRCVVSADVPGVAQCYDWCNQYGLDCEGASGWWTNDISGAISTRSFSCSETAQYSSGYTLEHTTCRCYPHGG